MTLTERLVEQCRRPKGLLGGVMIGFMNLMDTGLTGWAVSQINTADSTATILDIGCGGGKTVRTLSKAFPQAKVFGVDYSEDAVRLTKSKNKSGMRAGRVNIWQADVCALPFEDNLFTCITAIRTHYFWPNLPQGLREAFRVLQKGGRLLLLSELYKISYHMAAYNTNASLSGLLYETGFRSVKVQERGGCVCVTATK